MSEMSSKARSEMQDQIKRLIDQEVMQCAVGYDGPAEIDEAIYLAAQKEEDFFKAELETMLQPDTNPLTKMHVLLARGHIDQAQAELDACKDLLTTERQKSEYYAYQCRIHFCRGEWSEVIQCAESGMRHAPTRVTTISLLNMKAIALYEQGEFFASLQSIKMISKFEELYPHLDVFGYASSLQAKLVGLLEHPDSGLNSLAKTVEDHFKKKRINFDTCLAFFRIMIDLKRMKGEDYQYLAQACFLSSEKLGDNLYREMARLDYALNQGMSNEELVKNFIKPDQYQRVLDLVNDIVNEDGPMTAQIIWQNRRKEKTENQVTIEKISKGVKKILWAETGLLICLESKKFEKITMSQRHLSILKCLCSGPKTKEVFFKEVWGVKKFVRHLHENTLYRAINRINKAYGVQFKIVNGEISDSALLILAD